MQNQNDQQLINERKKKQMFLKEEILDKGLDPGKFSEYLCSIKPEGNNIDVWTYEELQSAVKAFKKGESQPSIQEQSLDETTMSFLQHLEKEEEPPKSSKNKKDMSLNRKFEQLRNDTTNNDQSFDKSQKSNRSYQPDLNETINTSLISQNPLRAEAQRSSPNGKDQSLMGIDPSDYVEVIPTQKSETTPLAKAENLVISVTNPEQVKGGVFSSAYIQYTVKTDPTGWNVKRRYNDFFWLRDTLQRLHPGVYVPPIPSKKSKNKFQEEVVKKRMFFFQTFLNACIEHADLKTDKYLYQFLSVLDGNAWEKMKEHADRIPKPRKVEELFTATGDAKLDVNPDLNKYISLTESYCAEVNPIYKKIRKISKGIVANFKNIANMAVELSQCFTNLQLHTTNFNKNVSPAYSLRFANFYPNLTKMMVSWSEQMQKQANLTYKNLFCFYKYSALENEVFIEMSNSKGKLEDEFHKQSREILARKEKLFAIGDMRQWDVDVPKARLIPKEEIFKNKELAFGVMLKTESEHLKYERDMVAYLNQSISAEISRGLEARCFLYNKNFEEFMDQQNESMNRLQTRWEELVETPVEPRSRSIAKAHLLNKSISLVSASTGDTSRASGKGTDKRR